MKSLVHSYTLSCALLCALTLGSLAAACGQTVDPAELSSIADYQSWPVVQTTGKLPAHNDTVRLIYINDVAITYPGVGEYLPGSVLVKEIYTKRSDGSAGSLSYVAIMRKLEQDGAPAGIDLEQGWLFTLASEVGKTEKTGTCWSSCHVQAPYDGAWLDYGAHE